MMIETVRRICAEPQQILPTAGNEGTFKVIFKEEVSYHLFPPVPTCSILNTISRLREVETDEPLPCPKSIQRSGTGSAPAGVWEYSAEGEGWARGVLRPLQASPSPEHPRRSPHSSPNQAANSCWAVTSQFAVSLRKKGTRGGAGGETLPVCSHHQSRSHFLPFRPGPKGQCVQQTQLFVEIHLWVCFCVLENRLMPLWLREKNCFFDTSELSSDFSTSYKALFPKSTLPPLPLHLQCP